MEFDKKALERLEQLRDEIKVKSHLLKADLKDEWQKLEKEWEKNQQTIGRIRNAASQTGEDLKKAGQSSLSSLKEGYQRVKSALENQP